MWEGSVLESTPFARGVVVVPPSLQAVSISAESGAILDDLELFLSSSAFIEVGGASKVYNLADLEHRVACAIASNVDAFLLRREAREVTVRTRASPLRVTAGRPASAYPVAVLQAAMRRGAVTNGVLWSVASKITGAHVHAWRNSDVVIHADVARSVVSFPSPKAARIRVRDLLRFCQGGGDHLPALAQAICALEAFLALHPLLDGNGRVARAMFQAVLARRGLLTGPALPIGPMLKLNGPEHSEIIRRLILTGDWNPVFAFVAEAAKKRARLF